MVVKKAGKIIFGAKLTAAEKKALEKEMQRYFAEYDRKNVSEINAMVLWQLHKVYGFGPKRLKRFYDAIQMIFKKKRSKNMSKKFFNFTVEMTIEEVCKALGKNVKIVKE